LLTVPQASAAATLTAAQAKDHVGETATVCGVVASATFAARSKGQPTFLNLDKPYPEPIFTALIWGSERAKFGQPEAIYKDKRICVTGTIKAYRGVPQIVVTEPGQIKGGAATQQGTMQEPRTTTPPTGNRDTILRDPLPSPLPGATALPLGRPRMPRGWAKAGDCESGHWIAFVSDDGDIIKLDDESVWQVDPGDTADAATWVPPVDVIVCDDKIINLDDNEQVGVTRLR
jgi:hypothetical protein